jgi:predicted ATP-grasp superfamily ATP-dependent carboligase
MLDQRLQERFFSPPSAHIKIITPEQDCLAKYNELLQYSDAVWPIAPESGGVLQMLCAEVEKSGKILLNSSAEAVAITGNKWLTCRKLIDNGIPTIPSVTLDKFEYRQGEWMVKSIDGVGCSDSFVITQRSEFEVITADLNKSGFIVQPHINGLKTSLSCLFNHGRGWLLSVNLQQFIIAGGQYKLARLIVNISAGFTKYLGLIAEIGKAFPGLWGYVGIDLIETEDQLYVLEINPRLTSSFAGIYSATGVNPARSVIELLTGNPDLKTTCDQPVGLVIQE